MRGAHLRRSKNVTRYADPTPHLYHITKGGCPHGLLERERNGLQAPGNGAGGRPPGGPLLIDQTICHRERGKLVPVRRWSFSPISCTFAKRRGSSTNVWR